MVLAYSGVCLKIYSGLPFTYEIRKGGMDNTQKNCELTDVGKARASVEFCATGTGEY